MRLSELFSKTTKNLPEAEETKNPQLLIKGGFAQKIAAGVYVLLPLGLRVLNKINNVIREEMNALGAQELLLSSLVPKKYWEQSGRWDVPVAYKVVQSTINSQQSTAYALGWTHEEVVAALAKHFIQPYKDFPKAVYQIQTKFRAEARAQAGLLRGREFLMKDLYSFHADVADLEKYYQKVIKAYQKIFSRLSLKTLITEASGGAFTKDYTHEFQVLNPAGEDTVYYCEKCDFSQNQEIYKKEAHKNCNGEVKSARAIEVGNVFKLGTKFSQAFDLNYLDEKGQKHLVVMGSYGIGPTRVLGTLVEEHNDDRGIIWPASVSPFRVHLVSLVGQSKTVAKSAEKFYTDLNKSGVEVLFGDRDVSAGQKLADADLLGITWRAVISEKTCLAGRQAGDKIELKARNSQEAKLMSFKEVIKLLSK